MMLYLGYSVLTSCSNIKRFWSHCDVVTDRRNLSYGVVVLVPTACTKRLTAFSGNGRLPPVPSSSFSLTNWCLNTHVKFVSRIGIRPAARDNDPTSSWSSTKKLFHEAGKLHLEVDPS